VKVVAESLGVARSNLIDRLKGRTKPRRRYQKAQDAAVVPRITALVSVRPTYGYRRITAILNRRLRSEGLEPVNHKRVYRIMKAHNLLLARKYSERPEHVHDGKVIVMRSNLRWCSDGFEFTRLGMATPFVAPSSSTPTTAKSLPGAPWRMPASAVRTSAT
jgi:putative transposase